MRFASSNNNSFRDKLRELKPHISVTDVALKLGYRIDKAAGVGKYVEMVLGAAANPIDKIVVFIKCDKAHQTYFRRDGSKGDAVTLIKENLNSFHTCGRSDWEKVINVMADMANMPLPDYHDAEMITKARNTAATVFDTARYDVKSYGEDAHLPKILAERGFSYDTFEAFKPFITAIRDKHNDAYNGYNVGFPYQSAGNDKIEGYEIRGAKGFKSKAAGTNSSTAAWIADFSTCNPDSVKDVYFFESAFDAMAFYQVNKFNVDRDSMVLVSVGGGCSGKAIENILSHYSTARAIDAFDNDIAGESYGKKMREIARKLNSENPEQQHSVSAHKAPDGYKDWNDALLGKTIEVANLPNKYDRNENLASKRSGQVKL